MEGLLEQGGPSLLSINFSNRYHQDFLCCGLCDVLGGAQASRI
jgi:hypothetical protein